MHSISDQTDLPTTSTKQTTPFWRKRGWDENLIKIETLKSIKSFIRGLKSQNPETKTCKLLTISNKKWRVWEKQTNTCNDDGLIRSPLQRESTPGEGLGEGERVKWWKKWSGWERVYMIWWYDCCNKYERSHDHECASASGRRIQTRERERDFSRKYKWEGLEK